MFSIIETVGGTPLPSSIEANQPTAKVQLMSLKTPLLKKKPFSNFVPAPS